MDYSTLASWDEAWYGSIARNILKTGSWFLLTFNGKPYFDHPPLGFWLMAISYKLFGINEFSTRLPSAFLGLVSVFLIFTIAYEMTKKKVVGLAASLILGTCVWYVIRVRSGNLDAIFVFFYLLTVFFAMRSAKNFRWFPLTALAFAGLVLSKTIIGISAIVLIGILNLRQLVRVKNIPYLLAGGILFAAAVLPWYYINNKIYSDFYYQHFIVIGTREKKLSSFFHLVKVPQTLFYLHMGVRKWYYIWIAATSYLLLTFRFIKKQVFFLLSWTFIVLYPFLTSEKTELWHLIPVYVPLSLLIAVGLYDGIERGMTFVKGFIAVPLRISSSTKIVFLAIVIYISLIQSSRFRHEVFAASKYVSDEPDIAKKAAHYPGILFLDDDFLPVAVFYSGRDIRQVAYEPEDKKSLVKLFQSDEKNIVVITRYWAVKHLDEAHIGYKVLDGNKSFSIISRP
ncbi:glycosyltransferase family 39 protein [Candidatus Roizmanbacteria bacterium]|nr:glycosyltransferase family 39 protein [Candidatus Roizmanbacteria bacterium]